MLVQDFVV